MIELIFDLFCLDDIAKKDSSKEKMLTQIQRSRFDTLFPNFHERFRPRTAPGTNNQNANPPSTSNNESTVGGGDANLPRKEERTPSDSQSITNERPMIEVKKLKTQK